MTPAGQYGPALTAAARERRSWPRCRACGLALHPSLEAAGTHALCSDLPPHVWDALAGWEAPNA